MIIKEHKVKLTMETLHKNEEPWNVNKWMMFNIFNNFLQSDTNLSVAEAARCFDAILPDNRPDTPDHAINERERAESWLWIFADIIWKLARQIPYDSEIQDRIMHLFEELDRLPFTQTFEEEHFWASKLLGWEDPSRCAHH